jgi:hypothetical protein
LSFLPKRRRKDPRKFPQKNLNQRGYTKGLKGIPASGKIVEVDRDVSSPRIRSRRLKSKQPLKEFYTLINPLGCLLPH